MRKSARWGIVFDLPRGWRLVLQPAFLPSEQFVEFFNQLQKAMVVSLLLNQRAQLVHAFAFVWSHRDRQMICLCDWLIR